MMWWGGPRMERSLEIMGAALVGSLVGCLSCLIGNRPYDLRTPERNSAMGGVMKESSHMMQGPPKAVTVDSGNTNAGTVDLGGAGTGKEWRPVAGKVYERPGSKPRLVVEARDIGVTWKHPGEDRRYECKIETWKRWVKSR